ncbi:MAG TPA: SDR family NAD(P)-dependent oxidoreductase [Rectinemataceae bacterium]|nr:SDR family NAD(P)-dependent oxidoreductase [Rectinemataceae bacterium]
MEMYELAALLRGIALEAAEAEGAVVASRELKGREFPPSPGTDAVAGKPLILELERGMGESAAIAALRDGLRRGIGPGDKSVGTGLAIGTTSGEEGRLFAVGPDIDSARALLENGSIAERPGASTPEIGSAGLAGSEGSALGRDKVVSERIALVTGGAQGFGEEITRGLAASGALVWIADINFEGAERLAAELNKAAGRTVALPLAMDVTNEASVTRAFAEIAFGTGGLDLVVSNAGVLKAASIFEQELAAFDFVTKVNYTGFFLVAKAAAKMMRLQRLGAPSRKTDIIQINSKSGLEGSNKNASYAGSKFGSLGLVQSFALELVEYGIKVNAICPGNFFDGPLWSDPEKGLFVQYLRTGKVKGAKSVADVKAFYEAKVPMGRGCEGQDVMRAIYYLVEQEYETGQALPVTGGQVMLN